MKTTQMILIAVFLTGGGTTIAIGRAAQDKDPHEKTVTLQQLPAAVQAAVKEQTKGATVKGFSVETEKGKKLYEAALIVNGHAKDISFDANGTVVSVEEETTLDKIPVPARAALEKAADTGKIALVEIVTEGGKTSYEAQIKNGRKTSEIAVDATGRKVN